MSAVPTEIVPPPPVANLKIDQDLGRLGVWFLIATEGFLFVDLFFAYFYLGNGTHRWETEVSPPLHYVLPLLGILIFSSVVVHVFGEKPMQKGNYRSARLGVAGTIFLGLCFLGLEAFSFAQSWSTITPATDSYGSISYIIQFFHAAHVVAGLLMLAIVLFLPVGDTQKTPHRALHTASMYWHFVDVVWVFVVLFLFIVPNLHSVH